MRKCILSFGLLVGWMPVSAQTVFTLSDCREMATSNNTEIQIAAENVKVAERLRKAAKTQFLPSISANGGYVHNQKNLSLLGKDQFLPVYAYNADGTVNYSSSWNNNWTSYAGSMVPTDASGTPFNPSTNPEKIQWKYKTYIPKDAFEFDMSNIFTAAVTVTQPLFTGGKVLEMNRIAKSNKNLAQAQQTGEIVQTIVDTEIAYWRIVSLANKEKLANSYVELLRKMESNISKAIAVGVATKSDGLTVKVKLNDAEMSLLQVQNGLVLSRMALCQICRIPLDSKFKLQDELGDSLQEFAEVQISTDSLGGNRHELQALEQGVQIAESTKKLAVSRFMPNAALVAGYTTSNPNMFSGVEKKFDGQYQVGVVVNVPIFHFGERIQTLGAAKSAKNIAELKLEEAREKIELDITQAKFKHIESFKKMEMTLNNKRQAEDNLKYANVGFDAGAITASTFMEAQTAWQKAYADYIDAVIDVRMTGIQLNKALGILSNNIQ